MTWNGIVSHAGHAIIAARQTTASDAPGDLDAV